MAATLELAPRDQVDDPGPRGTAQPWAAGRPSPLDPAAALVPAVLMLVVGLVGLDRQSVWRDEAASLVAARRPLPDLWAMLTHTEVVHALYYTLLHGWLLLGTSESWARVPSVLAMAGAAGLVGLIGARLVSAPTGLVAGLIFVANPSVSFYAQEARSTALVAVTALLATWFLLRAVDRRTPRWWVAYGAACAVLVGLNVLALLVPVGLGLTLLRWRVPRRTLACWALATVPAVGVGLVLTLTAAQQTYQIGWIPGPGVTSLRELAHLLVGPTHPLLVVGALLLLVAVLPTRSPVERRLQTLALPMLVLPSAVLLVVSFVQPVFVPRYVFPSVAAGALLAALGLARLVRGATRVLARGGQPPRALAAVLCVVGVLGIAGLGVGAQRAERTPESRPDDLAGAAAAVAAQAQPGDRVLFLPDNRRLVELVYPQDFVETRDVSLAQDPVGARNLTGRSLPVASVLAGLDDSDRVWAIGRPGLELQAAETGSVAERDRLERDFVATRRSDAHGVGVVLYVRRTPAS